MSSYPHLLLSGKDFARRRHSGWSLSTPSFLSHNPALSLPVPEEKFRFQSETHPSMPAHATHTHSHGFLWELGLSRKEDGQEQKSGYVGLLLPPTTRTRDAHTCTRSWGWACIPSLGDEDSSGDPGWEKRGLYTWLLMWVMPRLKTNCKQLPIPVRGFWLCMQSTWAEILGV